MGHVTMTYHPVRDFERLRFTCQHGDCGMAFELRPEQVEAAMAKTGGCCPLCGKPFTNPKVESGADALSLLAKAVVALNRLGEHVWVEFPVRAP